VTAGFEYVSASPADVVAADWQMFTSTASVVVRLPQAVWNVGRSLFTDDAREATSVVSVVGVGRMAGEVTGDPSSLGLRDTRQVVAVLLSLLASLNMALFVFNLIPLPPLDGGHIVGACYEWARGALAPLDADERCRTRLKPANGGQPVHAYGHSLYPLKYTLDLIYHQSE